MVIGGLKCYHHDWVNQNDGIRRAIGTIETGRWPKPFCRAPVPALHNRASACIR